MSHKWQILYHPEVKKDLAAIGKSRARRVIKAIEEKLTTEPEKFGSPLRKELAGLRKLRTGGVRIVYRVEKKRIEVYIIVVGRRADSDAYKQGSRRILTGL